MKKRILSMILAIVLVVSMVPSTVFAAETDNLCDHHAAHTEECGYVEGESDCTYHCDECLGHTHDDTASESDVAPATDETVCEHNYTTEVKDSKIPATCMATGSVTMACDCGETEVQTLPIDPENHTGKNSVVGEVKTTCGADGYTGDTVCECGAKIATGETEPATGKHEYSRNNDTSCNVCDYVRNVIAEDEGKVEVTDDFHDEDIPDTLKAEGFETVEEIKNALIEAIVKENKDAKVENTVLYDATLMVPAENGKTWVPADENTFLKDGRVLASLSVPEGTSPKTHNYAVAYMVSTSAYGKTAGDVEYSEVEVRIDEGNYYIEFYVTGNSSILVCWTENESDETNASKEYNKFFNRNKFFESGKRPNTTESSESDKGSDFTRPFEFDKGFDFTRPSESGKGSNTTESSESGKGSNTIESSESGKGSNTNESSESNEGSDSTKPSESSMRGKPVKHNWGNNCMKGDHKYVSVVTEPTCDRKGYTTHTCKYCYKSYKDSYTRALGHDWDRGKVTKKATCTRSGMKVFKCDNCHKTYPEKIKATGHKYKSVVTEPTCERRGYTTYTCRHCHKSYKDSYTRPEGHDWDRGKVTKKATCTRNGVRTFRCDDCDKTRTEVIKATGHNYMRGMCVNCGKRVRTWHYTYMKYPWPSYSGFWK